MLHAVWTMPLSRALHSQLWVVRSTRSGSTIMNKWFVCANKRPSALAANTIFCLPAVTGTCTTIEGSALQAR